MLTDRKNTLFETSFMRNNYIPRKVLSKRKAFFFKKKVHEQNADWK
jgi:hypothetical protein